MRITVGLSVVAGHRHRHRPARTRIPYTALLQLRQGPINTLPSCSDLQQSCAPDECATIGVRSRMAIERPVVLVGVYEANAMPNCHANARSPQTQEPHLIIQLVVSAPSRSPRSLSESHPRLDATNLPLLPLLPLSSPFPLPFPTKTDKSYRGRQTRKQPASQEGINTPSRDAMDMPPRDGPSPPLHPPSFVPLCLAPQCHPLFHSFRT